MRLYIVEYKTRAGNVTKVFSTEKEQNQACARAVKDGYEPIKSVRELS